MKILIDGNKEVEVSEVRFADDLLQVVITSEGVIFDVLDDEGNEVIGTRGMTFDEWADFIRPKPVNEVVARLQQKYAGEDGSLLDEDIIEQYSINATEVNNSGIEAQIEELVQSMGEEAAEVRLREIYGT